MSDAASEITRLRDALAASEARAEAAESELAQTRAVVSTSEAMIKHLKLEIAKLRREHYGHSAERRARLIDQMELQLEELEAAATEDEIEALNVAKTSAVAGFERRRPTRTLEVSARNRAEARPKRVVTGGDPMPFRGGLPVMSRGTL